MTPIARCNRSTESASRSSRVAAVRSMNSGRNASWKSRSQLPAIPGRTRLRSAGAPQLLAAVTLFHQLRDRLALARLAHSKSCSVAVGLRVLSRLLEAAITITRALSGCRINFVQIGEHGGDGSVQGIQIQPVEASLFLSAREI